MTIATFKEQRTEQRVIQAAVVTAPGRVEIHDGAVAEPGPGQVRIRLEGCGVCASNLTPWSGPDWMTFPTEPGGLGHEGWGMVEAVGPGVEGIAIGDRVGALSYHAYATHDLADAEAVVVLPDALADRPFPAEPLGCAMNIFARSGIKGGDTVAIIGIGFLGALLTQLATAAGARVIAIGRRAFALDLARQAGAAETIAMIDHWEIIEEVRRLTEGQFCDVVIEAVGSQWPLDLAAELTRERGRLVIAGYHQDGARQVNMQMWNWRGLDVINAHERDPKIYLQGMRAAVDAVVDGRLKPDALYTHRYALSELDQALDATRDRPDGFMKALIMMEDVR
ncbi:L-iditol 2-dehydrogenase [Xaviernesmea oryzae]|uniref:L-iditol 2-dehydrogenase n=1 Tax=Xaviernesmea oryzae TaxID=464029 RepID=A0A1Q9B282_9HYPH|nr:zinc-binding dehydrogenase [Xaviernesmea oryzae]OLP62082.1 L-iditol 2-dehydrogenase [Xaviernesmea oryzae]SEL86824.1 Threonine dehydrogenase [Xaviernesmea oryzae]